MASRRGSCARSSRSRSVCGVLRSLGSTFLGACKVQMGLRVFCLGCEFWSGLGISGQMIESRGCLSLELCALTVLQMAAIHKPKPLNP